MAKKEVLEGNVAIAESAIRAGCRFFAGYPITPQSTITEYLSNRLFEVEGGFFVQAESEVASVYMVQGASGVGARALTATSGQGFSLMTEGMSILAAQDFPAVIIDVERGGAGGCPIFPSQSDYNFVTKSIGHGGYHAYVLGPATVQEAVDVMYEAYEFAEKYQCLVIILTDGMQGQMMEAVELPPFKEVNIDKPWAARGCADGTVRRVGCPLLTTEEDVRRHDAMFKSWQENELKYEEFELDDAEVAVIAWGSAARTAKTPIKKLRAEGKKIGLFRPITLYPFPFKQIEDLAKKGIKKFIVLENAVPAQMYEDVMFALKGSDVEVELYTRCCGTLISPEEAEEELRKMF